MGKNELFKTNMLVGFILLVGFTITAIFGYHASYQSSLDNIEHVSSLTAEGVYYQLSSRLTKPVNAALTMSHDSLLVEHLTNEKAYQEDEKYIEKTTGYLKSYQERYGYDAVYFVSAATGRYYSFNGIDRVLCKDDPKEKWFYRLLESKEDYQIDIDKDETLGSGNVDTVFANCKVKASDGTVLGIVGVGIRVDTIRELLEEYQEKFAVQASLLDNQGNVAISTQYDGAYPLDWFQEYGQENIRDAVMSWKEEASNMEIWSESKGKHREKSYIASRYIPELSWHLVVQQDAGEAIGEIRSRLFWLCLMGAVVIFLIGLVIAGLIRRFNKQLTQLMEERHSDFRKATEQMYDNIYELNVSKNDYVGKRTREYFDSFGIKGLPYDKVLDVIAKKQIKEEFREGYISTFTPENVIREFESGNEHLQYDFMMTENGKDYLWMRIDAYIFHSQEDGCIHMFVYRKNIEKDKQHAEKDEMTDVYTKKAAERTIDRMLLKDTEKCYAFFIFDIDNFKQANDRFGHAFGDYCIKKFVRILKNHFRQEDVLGRLGGDEFAAFIPVADRQQAEEKADRLSKELCRTCREGDSVWDMSASIGVAIAPEDGRDFNTLYKNADEALYVTKENGKNGYTIFQAGSRISESYPKKRG